MDASASAFLLAQRGQPTSSCPCTGGVEVAVVSVNHPHLHSSAWSEGSFLVMGIPWVGGDYDYVFS